jgi:hypothetical protein
MPRRRRRTSGSQRSCRDKAGWSRGTPSRHDGSRLGPALDSSRAQGYLFSPRSFHHVECNEISPDVNDERRDSLAHT